MVANLFKCLDRLILLQAFGLCLGFHQVFLPYQYARFHYSNYISVRNYISNTKVMGEIVMNDSNKDTNNAIDSIDRIGGNGEWSDWENNDAHLEDDFVNDDGAMGFTPSTELFQISQIQPAQAVSLQPKVSNFTIKSNLNDTSIHGSLFNLEDAITRRSSNTSWEGWSEEPPYFDESDVDEIENSWGKETSELSAKYSSYGGEHIPISTLKTEVPLVQKSNPISEREFSILIKRIDYLEKQMHSQQKFQYNQQNVRRRGKSFEDFSQFIFMAMFLTLQYILIKKL